MTNPTFQTLSVAAILREAASRTPDATAVEVGTESISYGRLWHETRAYAGALRDLGVKPGDAVAMLIPNVPDFPRVYYAILGLGAIVVPVHALLKAEEIAYVLRDSGASMLVCAAPLLGTGAPGGELAGVPVLSVLSPEPASGDPAGGVTRLEALAAEAEPIDSYVSRAPHDIATILYTSGTTGKPKGALGSHLALVEQANTLLLNTFDLTAA
ncbi:MAG: long-chain-fatty-acid--CoA ligase, partial [Microbacteriaceae bacterium]|nr:long-chain-fatty-acid--CoA ligase [Microbacteriaceae bacterium]